MTNEQILEQQVEALEKLLKLKQAVVEELEAKVSRLENSQLYPGVINTPFIPYVRSPFTQVVDRCTVGPSFAHEYPSSWGGTTPPRCTKCGMGQWATSGVITSTSHAGVTTIGSGGCTGGVASGVASNTIDGSKLGLGMLIDAIKNR